jgi:hypothetical protein
MHFFTLCSNNYLGQASVLGKSVLQHHPAAEFTVFLIDELSPEIKYGDLGFEVIPIADIEPDILSLAVKYDIVELNTSVKPRVFEYLMTVKNQEKVIYLDPDIRVYSYFEAVDAGLDKFNILLTPHIFTPIPHDGKTPQESLFLNYGIYNLGFIAVRKSAETLRFMNWWRDWTYNKGYNSTADGIFVDQLPVNFAPLFFEGVDIIHSRGYNMAPWNLHERILSTSGNNILVNEKDRLAFYHFSSFRLGSFELPVHGYTRYTMQDRPDLRDIHLQYDQELGASGYQAFRKLACSYVGKRKEYLLQKRANILSAKPFYKRAVLAMTRMGTLRKIVNMININNKSFDEYYESKIQ